MMIIRLLTIFTILSTPLYAAYNVNDIKIIRKDLECAGVKIPQNVYLNTQENSKYSLRREMTNIFNCNELYHEDNIFIKKSEKVFVMKENPYLDAMQEERNFKVSISLTIAILIVSSLFFMLFKELKK